MSEAPARNFPHEAAGLRDRKTVHAIGVRHGVRRLDASPSLAGRQSRPVNGSVEPPHIKSIPAPRRPRQRAPSMTVGYSSFPFPAFVSIRVIRGRFK